MTRSYEYSDIKRDLKDKLKVQSVLKDYDFRGSVSDVLIGLLANHTHENAFIANANNNEAYLHSAKLRRNVVSRALDFGYVPHSIKAARASISLTFTSGTAIEPGPSYVLPKGTIFKSKNTGTLSVAFTTDKAISIERPVGGTFVDFGIVPLVQGLYNVQEYVKDSGNVDQRFEISNENVDTDYTKVYVEEEQGKYVEYANGTGNINLDSNSRVYFIRENLNGLFEIYFGGDIIGKEPEDGKSIRILHLVTIGEEANGLDALELFRFAEFSNELVNMDPEVIVTQVSYGAKAKETIEEIRAKAPQVRFGKNTAFSDANTIRIIKENYPEIRSANVWGGQTSNERKYGYVYFSLNPFEDVVLTDQRIKEITNEMQNQHAIAGLQTMIHVEHESLFIRPSILVEVKNSQIFDKQELEQEIRDNIEKWKNTNLEVFDASLRFSRFGAVIDNSSSVIESNTTTIELEKRLRPVLNTREQHSIDFQNRIKKGTVRSSAFRVAGQNWSFSDDDGRIVFGPSAIDIGSIDYETGVIKLEAMTIQSTLALDHVSIIVAPQTTKVETRENVVMRMSNDDVYVSFKVENDG